MWIFDFVFRIFRLFLTQKIFFLDSIIFPKKKFGDLTLSNLPLTNTTSSFSTTSTSSIPSTNRRSTGLHPYIYSRLWLFQMRTAASGTEAESICLFRTSLSFRVQRNIVPLWDKKVWNNFFLRSILVAGLSLKAKLNLGQSWKTPFSLIFKTSLLGLPWSIWTMEIRNC